jgi:hypothetical protein
LIGNNTTAKPMKKKRRWAMDAIQPWRTVNVVPVGGIWSNRFRTNSGGALNDPCPAVLIQERGSQSRVVFATYCRGVLMPACDLPGYEESSPISGSRTHPYRPGAPPWERLDEIDPAQKVAEDAAAVQLAKSYILPPPQELRP